MERIFREILHYLDRIGPQGWLLVLASLILVGMFCLRGFGSRSKY